MRCPKCNSPAPHLHLAIQFEGEVQPCDHDFHRTVTPEMITLQRADSRTQEGTLICPYCGAFLRTMNNPEDYVDSTTVDKCEKCGKRFFVVLQWNGYTVEDVRQKPDRVYRRIPKEIMP